MFPRAAARAGGVDHLRGEALHPPVDGDLVDVDAAFGEKFFDVAVGEPEAQVPAESRMILGGNR